MGYVGVKGGKDAIINSEKLVDYFRKRNGGESIKPKDIKNQFRLSIDRVMSEGSLYSPDIASIALKQAEGDVLEASYLVRAFRSTLPRIGYTIPANSSEMFVIRRISSAFQDIPGGQILGPSRDYSQRLINFSLVNEEKLEISPPMVKSNESKAQPISKVIDFLRSEGLLPYPEKQNPEEQPIDITREPLTIPLKRSGRLQRLTRGEEGVLLALAYSNIRGWGNEHPTLGEVRVGYLPVKILHPYFKKEVTIGKILATEVDAICEFTKKKKHYSFNLGYGFVFGQNERKTIAMAIIDRALSSDNNDSPVKDQEFVLSHIDGIESQGFISHLKMPHYVTFQSSLDRLRKIKSEKDKKEEQSLVQI